MPRTHQRTDARKLAAQILYTAAIRSKSATELLRSGAIDCIDATLTDYTICLVEGVEKNASDLDVRLDAVSQNWAVTRMPIMDHVILRIALFEMLHVDDVPISVSINEAVEIAKTFGGDDDSHKFVNGLLGQVARQLEEE